MTSYLTISFIIFSSFILTKLLREYTLKKKIIDIPNKRSSHVVPTPRGGGLSIVLVFLVSINFIDTLSQEVLLAFIGAGVIVAAIGFLDDYSHIPAKWRLLVHFIAAGWVLFWLGGLTEYHIFNYHFDPGFIGLVIIAFIFVWLLNLFNFMDGIDGIAASEAIFITTAGAYFSWIYGLGNIALVSVFLAAATSGFLILNWPPAKIFLGDVGSGFLGLTLGIIAYLNILNGVSVWVWLILFAVFLVDASVTLLKRLYLKEKWYEAHCSHAYQYAAKNWGHKPVTVAVILINMFWLFPLAYLVYLKPGFATILTIIAYLPLIVAAIKLKAGTAQNNIMPG